MHLTETACAKINLALHVRGRRADGYHDIETLFAFVDAGDTLTAKRADDDRIIRTCDEQFLPGTGRGTTEGGGGARA